MKIKLYLVFHLLISCIYADTKFEKKDLILAESIKSKITIRWNFRTWPEGLIGFNLYRSDNGKGFVKINKSLIRPELTIKRALELKDLQMYNSLRRGLEAERSFDVIKKYFNIASASDSLNRSSYLLSMSNYGPYYATNYDDHSVKIEKTYKYQLKRVFKNKKENEVWRETKPVKHGLTFVELDYKDIKFKWISRNSIRANWSISTELVKKYSLSYFRINHAQLNEAFKKVYGIKAKVESEKDGRTYYEFDINVLNSNELEYAIQAFPEKGVVFSSSPRFRPGLPLPGLSSKLKVEKIEYVNNLLNINWAYKESTPFKGFKILIYSDIYEKNLVFESKLIDYTKRNFVKDIKLKSVKPELYTKILIKSIDYRSDQKVFPTILKIPKKAIPKPQNFKAEYHGIDKTDGSRMIKLTFDAIDDPNVKGYYVEFKTEKISFRTIKKILNPKKTSLIHYTYNSGLATYRIRAISNMDNQSAEVKYYIPGKVVEKVKINQAVERDDTFYLQWQFTGEIKTLSHFNLFVDGKLAKTIKGNKQEIALPFLDHGETYKVEMETVNIAGFKSDKSSLTVTLNESDSKLANHFDLIFDKEQKVRSLKTFHNKAKTKVHLEYTYILDKDNKKIAHGAFKKFNGEGKLYEDLNYKYGKLDGIQKYYDFDGNFIIKQTYKDGILQK